MFFFFPNVICKRQAVFFAEPSGCTLVSACFFLRILEAYRCILHITERFCDIRRNYEGGRVGSIPPWGRHGVLQVKVMMFSCVRERCDPEGIVLQANANIWIYDAWFSYRYTAAAHSASTSRDRQVFFLENSNTGPPSWWTGVCWSTVFKNKCFLAGRFA